MDYSCIGIDFNENNAIISYLNSGDKEPETASTVVGKEEFLIPVCVVKKVSLGQWLYGKEACNYSKENNIECQWNLMQRAENEENVTIEGVEYSLQDLFYYFLKKILDLPRKLGGMTESQFIVLSVEHVTTKNMQLFWICMEKMKIPMDSFLVIDHRESFCHYALHQAPELNRNLVAMFEFRDDTLICRMLMRNKDKTPNTVTVVEEYREYNGEERDQFFLDFAIEEIQGKIISSIYLTGQGFDGDWMKMSLKFICQGRRVFLGKNLYSKGACYGPDKDKEYLFLGENELKSNVSLKVKEHNAYKFFELITAGKNWYDEEKSIEIIIRGEMAVDFWIQPITDSRPRIVTYVINEWAEKNPGITRARITAKPVSSKEAQITIKDLGFGELVPASDVTVEYMMDISEKV